MSENKRENLFAKLAKQGTQAVPEEAPTPEPPAASEPAPSPALPAAKRPAATKKEKVEPAVGRRAHPDYRQANAYILKSVRRDVDRALLDLDGMDYSQLVEDLLVKWLKTRKLSG